MRTSKYPHGRLTRVRLVRRLVQECLEEERAQAVFHQLFIEKRRVEADEAYSKRMVVYAVILLLAVVVFIAFTLKELGTW